MKEKGKKEVSQYGNFEMRLARLQAIVQELENNEVGLTKAMSLFQEGMELGRDCQKQLEQVHKQVAIYADGNWQKFAEDEENENGD